MEFKALFVVLTLFLLVGTASADVAGFNATVDGYTARTAANVTIASLASGAGTAGTSAGTSMYTQIATFPGTTTDLFHVGTKIIWSTDTSPIPDNAVITDARFNYTVFYNSSTLGYHDIAITNGSLTTDGAIVAADYSRNGTTEFITRIPWTSISSSTTQRSVAFNAAGRAGINKAGTTTLFIQIGDLHDSSFSGTWATNPTVGANNTFTMRSNDHATPAYRPVLNITYYIPTPTPTPTPTATPAALDYPICEDMNFFFWNDSSSFGSDYNRLATKPQMSDAVILSAVVSDVTGEQTIGSFITEPFPTGKIMGPGLTRYRTYLNVSSAVGTTKYDFIPYNVSPSGIETKMFFGVPRTEEINSLTVDEYLTSYARRNYTTFLPGERLLIRVNASTTSIVERTAYFNIAGTEAASMVGVGYWICPDPTIKGPEINPPSPDSLIGTAKLWVKKFLKDVFE